MIDFKQALRETLNYLTKEDYAEYTNQANQGYIKISKHPNDKNVVILNYTDKTVYEKHWNDYTMTARGLIIDLKSPEDDEFVEVLAWPFEKFPNYASNEILGYEDDIDWNEVDAITEKLDGSLGISYVHKGKINFSTKGSLDSEQSKKALSIWEKKYAAAEKKYFDLYGDIRPTLLFEIIYPSNRVVVDYGSTEDLILIGVKDRSKDYTYSEMKELAESLGLQLVKEYNHTLEGLLTLKSTMSANEEGFIVRFNNGKRLKIKGDEYLSVHRIKYGMSAKAKYKAWQEGKLNEYIMQLPEEFRPELELFGNQLDEQAMITLSTLANQYTFISSLVDVKDKRAFGIYVSKNYSGKDSRHLFNINNGKTNEEVLTDIKKQITDNYTEYELMLNN